MNQQRRNPSMSSRHPSEQNAQQAFTDTLLRVQVHHARAAEERHQGKIPIPHYAKACALLDNFPLPPTPSPSSPSSLPNTTTTSSSSSSSSSSPSTLTQRQIELIMSLRLDNWAALANACIEAKEWVQAEAALLRLVSLQEQVAGHEFQARGKKQKKQTQLHQHQQQQQCEALSSSNGSTPSTTTVETPSTAAEASVPSPPSSRLTDQQYNAAKDLIDTLTKLQTVTERLGKQQLAKNMGMRIEKFRARLAQEDDLRSHS
ncbi:hypothetical protein BGW41_008077 [Actinomortierella wolfii]|nr:hypothetical protein BGW41_008077 [Actinomortierella wolfii]